MATLEYEKQKYNFLMPALHNGWRGWPGGAHDNDLLNIVDISVAPTQGEVLSAVEPFVPLNRYDVIKLRMSTSIPTSVNFPTLFTTTTVTT